MELCTLVLITDLPGNLVLLGRKKRGPRGLINKLNGFGGKVLREESVLDCVIRETKEECGVRLYQDSLAHTANLMCYAGGDLHTFVHVYRTTFWEGVPIETAEMEPIWFSLSALPHRHMLKGDRYWIQRALAGESFGINIYYREPMKKLLRTEFTSFAPTFETTATAAF